ncbi:MAG: hypothetical protein OXE81_10805 [Gammaproteobacteria bacterium]|nr:hypothetical protein [Gammaproteobacteria bacterium]
MLEERMKIMQAEYTTDIKDLALKMAERDAETAKRDTRMLLAIAGMLALSVSILGLIIAVS